MHTPSVFLIEPLESRIAPATFVVTSTADGGPGTLRQAILDANGTPAADSVVFDLAGAGVRTILLATPLPAITEPLAVDGTSQPGYVAGGRPLIELNGMNAGAGAIGLQMLAASTGVAALTINHFSDAGLVLGGMNGLVQSCYIGTDADGAGTGSPGNGTGIRITGGGHLIGGATAALGNVISGNATAGILLTGTGATGNLIVRNTIGLESSNPVELPNGTGVFVATGASGNRIGGTDGDLGNLIGGNTGAGVAIPFPAQSPGNVVTGNDIAFNGGLGIDLFSDGVTPNGAGHQNFPVLTAASIGGGRTVVRGTLAGAPSTAFEIQFFANALADEGGFGEGRGYSGSTFVTTDAAGIATFAATIDVEVVTTGFITATAIAPAGDTSEFSQARAVVSGVVVPSIAPSGRIATFTDVDGDLVTVTVNKGRLEPADFQLIAAGTVGGAQLQLLDLHDDAGEFAGADLSITARRSGSGGDGFVNVGIVDSTGFDLGKVKIAGDLGRLLAGESATTTLGVKSLAVHSLGRLLLATQALDGASPPSLSSTITGAAGSVVIATDLITGSLLVTGNLDSLTVGRNLFANLSDSAAQIIVSGTLGKARIGGDIIGNTAESSGVLAAGAIKDITLGGSLLGGGGVRSGRIASDTSIGSVKIGGEVRPGAGELSGTISAGARIGSVEVRGTFVGNLLSQTTLGRVKIGGDMLGLMAAQGNAAATQPAAALAIAGVQIGGNFDGSILAGYDRLSSNFTNPDVIIGPILVGGNANIFRISAGVAPGPNAQFADNDDFVVDGGGAALLSQIASFIVKGQVGGFSTGEHVGLTAQSVGKLQVGSVTFPLTSGRDHFQLGTLGHISLREA
jgi:hypothetical protein